MCRKATIASITAAQNGYIYTVKREGQDSLASANESTLREAVKKIEMCHTRRGYDPRPIIYSRVKSCRRAKGLTRGTMISFGLGRLSSVRAKTMRLSSKRKVVVPYWCGALPASHTRAGAGSRAIAEQRGALQDEVAT